MDPATQSIEESLELQLSGFHFLDSQRIKNPLKSALLTPPQGILIGQLPDILNVYQNCLRILVAACAARALWTSEKNTKEFEDAIHAQCPLVSPKASFYMMNVLIDARRRFPDRQGPITSLA
ncbi:hypothetical protein F5Y04DRAFT_249356 [Hypomontagnella monticulosa]|nr:hypothetical protein F5Y04DRAFT_249356 [Hypomontagnella monticulosa]